MSNKKSNRYNPIIKEEKEIKRYQKEIEDDNLLSSGKAFYYRCFGIATIIRETRPIIITIISLIAGFLYAWLGLQ